MKKKNKNKTVRRINKRMNKMVQALEAGQAAVLVDEEYGYRYWVWLPRMTNEELATYWEAIESMSEHYATKKTLPGNFSEITQEEWGEMLWMPEKGISKCHVHEDCDSYLIVDGEKIRHKGYEPEYDDDDKDEDE